MKLPALLAFFNFFVLGRSRNDTDDSEKNWGLKYATDGSKPGGERMSSGELPVDGRTPRVCWASIGGDWDVDAVESLRCGKEKVNEASFKAVFSVCSRPRRSRRFSFSTCCISDFASSCATLSSNYRRIGEVAVDKASRDVRL